MMPACNWNRSRCSATSPGSAASRRRRRPTTMTQSAVSQIVSQLEKRLERAAHRPLDAAAAADRRWARPTTRAARPCSSSTRSWKRRIRTAQAEVAGTVAGGGHLLRRPGRHGAVRRALRGAAAQGRRSTSSTCTPTGSTSASWTGRPTSAWCRSRASRASWPSLPWREEEMVLACSPQHPLARPPGRHARRSLAGQKFVHFDQEPGRSAARWTASCASTASRSRSCWSSTTSRTSRRRSRSAPAWPCCPSRRCAARCKAGTLVALPLAGCRLDPAAGHHPPPAARLERRGPVASSSCCADGQPPAARPPAGQRQRTATVGRTATLATDGRAAGATRVDAAPARHVRRNGANEVMTMNRINPGQAGPLRPALRARCLRRRLRRRPQGPQVARHRRSKASQILLNLEHRGACGCETNTGDGAGILLQMPHALPRQGVRPAAASSCPPPGDYGVGMVFLPTDPHDRAALRGAVRADRPRGGAGRPRLAHRADRQRADRPDRQAGEPVMRQIFIGKVSGLPADRPRTIRWPSSASSTSSASCVENAVRALEHRRSKEMFYVPSLSCKTLVYKGMLNADAGRRRTSPTCATRPWRSALALVHSRFSTNTFPNWARAHPYRYVCPQRRDQHAARQRQLDARPREHVRLATCSATTSRRSCPIIDETRQRLGHVRQRAGDARPGRPVAAARGDDDDPRAVGRRRRR